MGLQFHTHIRPHISAALFSSHPPPQPQPPPSRASFKTHLQNSIFSTSQSQSHTPNFNFIINCTLSSLPTNSLCTPTPDNYFEADYVVPKLSAEEVLELVRGRLKVPIIIHFYATWSGPCNLMAQQLETLAVEYEGKLTIVKVDADYEHKLARDMQVRGLPTLYFISPNPKKDAIRTEGLIPLNMIRETLRGI